MHDAGIRTRRLRALEPEHVEQLAGVLIDCVQGGASVGFMLPITREHALAFWQRVASGVAAGERVLIVAEDSRGICGTAQLVLNLPDNQPHRADVVKLLVHTRARRQGVAAALMQALDAEAIDLGRWLLVLDAVTGGDAARLYERLGWHRAGDIPAYALFPDGRLCSTTYFWRDLRAVGGYNTAS